MEPGARCILWLPWLAPWPLKLWRFMAPAKPLPRLTAVTSTLSPLARLSTLISWPTSKPSTESRRSSTRLAPGSTPALAKCPASGLFSLRASLRP